MHENKPQSKSSGLYQRYSKLSTSKKVILMVFIVWLLQALPKWVVVIVADDQTSAKIMRFFYTPQADRLP
ncbi:MAG: hypothetical protein OEY36_09475 [Gammaproteobacteria bacterium]|nr:hypothetical protein [Gammaproteobacteria bacterium]